MADAAASCRSATCSTTRVSMARNVQASSRRNALAAVSHLKHDFLEHAATAAAARLFGPAEFDALHGFAHVAMKLAIGFLRFFELLLL